MPGSELGITPVLNMVTPSAPLFTSVPQYVLFEGVDSSCARTVTALTATMAEAQGNKETAAFLREFQIEKEEEISSETVKLYRQKNDEYSEYDKSLIARFEKWEMRKNRSRQVAIALSSMVVLIIIASTLTLFLAPRAFGTGTAANAASAAKAAALEGRIILYGLICGATSVTGIASIAWSVFGYLRKKPKKLEVIHDQATNTYKPLVRKEILNSTRFNKLLSSFKELTYYGITSKDTLGKLIQWHQQYKSLRNKAASDLMQAETDLKAALESQQKASLQYHSHLIELGRELRLTSSDGQRKEQNQTQQIEGLMQTLTVEQRLKHFEKQCLAAKSTSDAEIKRLSDSITKIKKDFLTEDAKFIKMFQDSININPNENRNRKEVIIKIYQAEKEALEKFKQQTREMSNC